METFRATIEKAMGKPLAEAAPTDEITQDKKDHLGVNTPDHGIMKYNGVNRSKKNIVDKRIPPFFCYNRY